ncbi:hypothetical protein Tco_1052667, partial [Tanacetum coccineum]
ESEAYKTYHAYGTGEKTPKTKSTKKKAKSESSPKTKPTQASKGKRIKTSGKGDKPAKKKQSATKSKGLTVLSDIALTKAKQMKIALKEARHNNTALMPVVQSSDKEDDDDEVNMGNDNDDDVDNQDDDDQEHDGQEDEEQDDVNKKTDSDNDDLRVHTPSTYESTDDEESDEEIQDVLVTTIAEPSLFSTTTLPPPPTPLITHLQQTLIPTPATAPSSSLQDLPNFGSLFGLRDEAQAKNADFINKLDDNIKKIIKDQVKEQVSKILPKIEKTVNEQLEAEVLNRSSNESKTSHAVATNLSKLEQKKILIDKMESNNALKETTSKTTGKSTEGSKSHQKSASEFAQAEEPRHTAKDLEEPTHQEFVTGVTEDQPDEETSQLPNCTLAQKEDTRDSFNELMDTPLDFSAFLMNRLKVDTLTQELLANLTFKLMKGSCKSLVELEYLFEEVYKEATDQLNWNNLE